MLKLVRPWLERLETKYASAESLNKTFAVLSFAILFLSALTTEVIGIHALFGAFLAGVSMPTQAGFRKLLASRIEDVSLVILLPLFFAFTGLKTQIGLLNDGTDLVGLRSDHLGGGRRQVWRQFVRSQVHRPVVV